ncbi:hypothetical protein ACIQ34_11945 [Ureibacillus sp. NPDC094379]
MDNSPINDESFLNNPQVIRPLFYQSDYISKEIDKMNLPTRKPIQFLITDDQLAEITLPQGKIGVNDFAKAVNQVIDQTVSKKLTGTIINKRLKELGILSETVDEEGRRKTIINDQSEGYGIESVAKSFNGKPYQQIVFNDIGKEFLLNNIRELMSY